MSRLIALFFITTTANAALYEWSGTCTAPTTMVAHESYCQAGTVAHIQVILSQDFEPGTIIEGIPWNPYILSLTYWDHDFDVATRSPDGTVFRLDIANPAWVMFTIPDLDGTGFLRTVTDPAYIFNVAGLPWRFATELTVGGYMAVGETGVWLHAPEPPTLALLPIALLGIAWSRNGKAHTRSR